MALSGHWRWRVLDGTGNYKKDPQEVLVGLFNLSELKPSRWQHHLSGRVQKDLVQAPQGSRPYHAI